MKRWCAGCRATKYLDEFDADPTRLDGYAPRCRACAADSQRKHRSVRDMQPRSVRVINSKQRERDFFTREEKDVWNQRLAELIARVRGRAA